MNASLLEMGLKMSIALGAVLVVFAVAIFIARKVSIIGQNKKSRNGQRRVQIEILGQRALAPGKQLMVIGVEGKRFLIGSTQQQLSNLAELEEEIEDESNETFTDSLRDSETRDSRMGNDLKSRLSGILRV